MPYVLAAVFACATAHARLLAAEETVLQSPPPQAELRDGEKSFLDALAAADLAEMELSRALKNGPAKPTVRKLAASILADDSANYQDLFKLCLNKHYAIAPHLDDRHSALVRRLRATRSGEVRGRVYVDAILVENKTGTDALLDRVACSSADADVAQFAAATSQMVKKHEAMARKLAGKTRG